MKFHGIYSQLITEYFQMQRNLGYKLRDKEYIFTQFDRLTTERNEQTLGISKSLSEAWCCRKPNESGTTHFMRIVTINAFSKHLNNLGYTSYVHVNPKYRCSFTPYIYSTAEISSIIEATDRYTEEKLQNSIYIFLPTLIRLLYCTGLRLSEALKIENKDVDIEERLITIRKSKNGTDRIIPLSNSITSILVEHQRNSAKSQKMLFKYNTTAEGCRCVLSGHFRYILSYAGIVYKGKPHGPRLHLASHCKNHYSLYFN